MNYKQLLENAWKHSTGKYITLPARLYHNKILRRMFSTAPIDLCSTCTRTTYKRGNEVKYVQFKGV